MKKVKKKTLKKLIFIFTLAIVIINCYFIIGGNTIFASSVGDPDTVMDKKTALSDSVDKDSAQWKWLGGLIGGLIGVVLFPIKIIIILLAFLIRLLMKACASIGGGTWTTVTIENILFAGYSNKGTGFKGIGFLDVNFFNGSKLGAFDSFGKSIATWYYVMRLISAAILLIILIYVGIRMAISTIASEKAKYKQMLTDWVVSMALLFLLHWIIIFVIGINSALITALGSLLTMTSKGGDNSWLMDKITWFADLGEDWNPTIGEFLDLQLYTDVFTGGITGFLAAILYLLMQGMAFSFLMFYLKRLITVGFLIIIAPLITITYSIDKMGDGKAQALNAWLKELVYNILIQPFHCVIYLAFFGTISSMLASDNTIASMGVYVLAFAVWKFIKQAEEILRKIFHFEANSMPNMSQPSKDFLAATGKMANIGTSAARGAYYFKNAGGFKALGKGLQDRSINKKTKKELKKQYNEGTIGENSKSFRKYKKTEDYEEKFKKQRTQTMEDIKKQKQEKETNKAKSKKGSENYDRKLNNEINKQVDAKLESALRKEYDRRAGEGAYDKLKAKAQEKDQNGNPTAGAKKAQATLDNFKNREQAGIKAKLRNDSQIRSIATDKVNQNILGNTLKNKAIKGFSKKTGKFFKWADSDVGKAAIAGLKDTLAVGSSIAAAAFAYGATEDWASAKMMSDLLGGKGFTGAMLERVSDTTVKDSSQLMNQYAAVNGMTTEEAKLNVNEVLNLASIEAARGDYKELAKKQKDLIKELTDKFGDKQAAVEYVNKMMSTVINGDNLDLREIVNNLTLSESVDVNKKEEAVDISKEFISLYIRSIMSNYNKVAEDSLGYDVDTFSVEVEKKVDVYNTYETFYQPGTTPPSGGGTNRPDPNTPRPPQNPHPDSSQLS